MSNKLSNIAVFFLILGGVALLLYPSISNYINSVNQSEAIADYINSVTIIDEEDNLKLIEQAKKFNEEIYKEDRKFLFRLTDNSYSKMLSYNDTDIMSVISIPKIKVFLPIYHGTSEAVLQIGIGHMEGSSLPVGGINTHVVLLGHRGLPSSKLFTNIDKLEKGDVIYIQTLNTKLAYEVDSKTVVEPKELANLGIEEGKELLTLVTCTPYGINTHRMLIKAHGIEVSEEIVEEIEENTTQVVEKDNNGIKDIVLMAVIIVILIIILCITYALRKRAIRKNKKLRNISDVGHDIYNTISIKLDDINRELQKSEKKNKVTKRSQNYKNKHSSKYNKDKQNIFDTISIKIDEINKMLQDSGSKSRATRRSQEYKKSHSHNEKNKGQNIFNTISIKIDEISKSLASNKKSKVTERSQKYKKNQLNRNNKKR